MAKSMRTAMGDLRLEELTVVHAGKEAIEMAYGIRAVPLSGLLRALRPLDGSR